VAGDSPIVANRVANGKPLVRRTGIPHPNGLVAQDSSWGILCSQGRSFPQDQQSAEKKCTCSVILSEAKNLSMFVFLHLKSKRDSSLRSE
jgi:hypothetical protein